MPNAADDEARLKAADELRRVREEAQAQARPRAAALPPLRDTDAVASVDAPETPMPAPPPARPDVDDPAAALSHAAPGGFRGLAFRALRRVLLPIVDAQIAANTRLAASQRAALDYVDARADATHRHYDAVLGQYGRQIEDANRRHVMLQADLVAHVHDLAKRIDLMIAEGERGRASLDVGLRDLRARVAKLEERLQGPPPR